MAAQVYTDQKIWFDGLDLTGQSNAIGVEYGVETDDNTTFGDSSRSNVGGLKTLTASISGFVDAGAVDAALFDAVGIEDKPVSFAAESAVGSIAYSFNAMLGAYNPEGELGRLFRFSANAAARSALIRGTLMERQAAVAATANGTGRQLGAVAAGKKLYAILHVLGVADPADELDVIIESAAASNFAGATTRVTFNTASAIGGQFSVPIAGEITDQHWRARWTVAGDAPSFDFVTILGIQ